MMAAFRRWLGIERVHVHIPDDAVRKPLDEAVSRSSEVQRDALHRFVQRRTSAESVNAAIKATLDQVERKND